MRVQVDPVVCASSLWTKLAFMRECDELCDFTIVVSGSKVKAHRCVLAATCDYFRTSFGFNDLSQSLTQADFTHLDIDVKAIEKVIQSCYTNEIDLEVNNLEGILLFADYLMHNSLLHCIEKFMNTTLKFSTAVLYFRLALQYGLHSSELINDIKWFLYSRFHDYFIYHPQTLEANIDLLNVFMTYDMFQYCTPLQITEFMLKNVRLSLEKLHTLALKTKNDLSSEMNARLQSTFTKMSTLFMLVRPEILEKWKPRLVDFMRTWRQSNLSADSDTVSELFWYVQALELQMSNYMAQTDCWKTGTSHTCWEKLLKSNLFRKTVIHEAGSLVVIACNNPKCDLHDKVLIPTPYIDANQPSTAAFEGSKLSWRLCICATENTKEWFANAQKSFPEESKIIPVAGPKLVENKSLINRNKTATNRDSPQTVRELDSSVREPDDTNRGSPQTVREIDSSVREPDDTNRGSPQTVSEIDSSVRESDDTPGERTALPQDVPRVVLPSRLATSPKNECNILVLLAPTADMTAQLLATDEGTDRRLVNSPKLHLCYYDIEMRRWCRGCKLDLPIPRAMLESHSWRIAFLNNCLYMFSVGHKVGLQYNTLMNSWVYLECQNIFAAHGSTSPVKSVIPIKVGNKLIVLSMSCESKRSTGFWTQYYFEMQDDCRTFSKVASIDEGQLEKPVTHWTVCDQTLVTINLVTISNGPMSVVQHINVYNAETRVLRTHKAFSFIYAGMKLLVRDQVIYICSGDSWCRIYDFQKSNEAKMKRCVSIVQSIVLTQNSKTTYPALTHMTCNAGSSQWEVISAHDRIHTNMVEMMVKDDGDLCTVLHPSPPFQFMTALSPSTMPRSQLDAMEEPVFTPINNLKLDFCYQART